MFASAPRSPSSVEPEPLWRVVGLGMALVLLAAAAYVNSFSVPFVFDDLPAIVENGALDRPWGGASDLSGGLTTSGRPVVHFSLWLNRRWSGQEVASYHVVNLAIHAFAGLALFGLTRCTLQGPALRAQFSSAATPLAAMVAAAWTLHPIQTESVTYVVQRAEALAGGFSVLCLYAFARAQTAPAADVWRALSLVACALAFASKESAAGLPVLVFLYDAVFVAGSAPLAWRQRRGWHLSFAACWVLLAALVAGTAGRGGTAGFATSMSVADYLLTQCRALPLYAGQALWPAALVFDYGTGTVNGLGEVFVPGLVVAGALAAVALAWRRSAPLAFAGTWCLVLLAPSSSVVPIATQTIAEHRVYLALAAPVVAAGAMLYRFLGYRAFLPLGTAVVALAVATAARNVDYRSDEAIWADTARKEPGNARAHNNLGQARFRAGNVAEAIASYEAAIRLLPTYPEPHYNLGVALADQGRIPEAIGWYERALALQPRQAEALNNLGNALVRAGRKGEGKTRYEQALAVRPAFAEAHNNLGNLLLQEGDARGARLRFEQALALKPRYPEARYNLGNARAAGGEMTSALEEYRRAIDLRPAYAEAHVNAGNALLSLGRAAEALEYYQRAVRLEPNRPDAHFNLASALLDLGRWDEAVPVLESVLRLDSDYLRAERALGFALAKIGRLDEARTHYTRYLRAEPGDAEAAAEWKEWQGRR